MFCNQLIFAFMIAVTISSGVAVLQYQSIEPMVLSFNAGDEVTILSKEAGQNKELWGAVVRQLINLRAHVMNVLTVNFNTHNNSLEMLMNDFLGSRKERLHT